MKPNTTLSSFFGANPHSGRPHCFQPRAGGFSVRRGLRLPGTGPAQRGPGGPSSTLPRGRCTHRFPPGCRGRAQAKGHHGHPQGAKFGTGQEDSVCPVPLRGTATKPLPPAPLPRRAGPARAGQDPAGPDPGGAGTGGAPPGRGAGVEGLAGVCLSVCLSVHARAQLQCGRTRPGAGHAPGALACARCRPRRGSGTHWPGLGNSLAGLGHSLAGARALTRRDPGTHWPELGHSLSGSGQHAWRSETRVASVAASVQPRGGSGAHRERAQGLPPCPPRGAAEWAGGRSRMYLIFMLKHS